jgi:DNA-binding response OmpR family regulator
MQQVAKPASILVADDQSNIRLTVRTALESEGYHVREAANGRQALDAVKQSPPDVMVLDLNMPEVDGMAVLEQMKLLHTQKRSRVIVLTAYGSIPTAVKAMSLGASDFIEKPLSPFKLRKTVRSVLDEPEPDRTEIAPQLAPHVMHTFDDVLNKVRKALRLADTPAAQALLLQAAENRDQHSAAYFNLLGALYETQGNTRMSRKYYGKSIDAARNYEPAKANLIRLNELRTTGRSCLGVALGDESEDVLYARMPDSRNWNS